jgi:hypothetical protein
MRNWAAITGLLLVLPGSAAEAGEKLSPSELRRLFPGSFQAVVHGAVTVNITARGNGTLIGRMKGKTDRGRWTLKGGTFCIAWNKWLGGKTSCSAVVADDGWYRGGSVKFRRI